MSAGSRDEWKVRILHISDLHERGPRESESFRRRRVLGEAWKRNLDDLLKDGPIDLVCFTGDVADWGKPEEYGPAADFIETLLQQLSLPLERLFLVPGNHDIDRKKGENAWAELRGGKDAEGKEHRGKLFRVPRLDLSRWMAGGAPPLGLEGVSREELLSRQSAYREWLSARLGRKELIPKEGAPHPFLGYRQTLRLPGHPFDIHIVGLDSAWLAGDEHDNGKLLLTTDQVGRLTTDKGEPLPGFRLALVHHPLPDLADKDECQRLLAENVDLLLRGHLHDEAVDTWEDPDRTSRQLAAGCLYEGHHADEWPNACHVITATLDANGSPRRYDLRFRSWSRRGHWYDDNGLYKDTKDGRLTWWIGQRPLPPSLPPTTTFVGRQHELEQLKAALLPDDRRPVAICAMNGMPGVGKSYLAARFAELHAEKFPGGCPRLVLNPIALPSVEVLLGQLGDQLQLPTGARMAERCRERLLRPLSLLIVENVDSREAAGVAVRLVSALQGGPILVTGRDQSFSEAGGWTRIEIQTLDEDLALQLVTQELGTEAKRFERAQLQRLVNALGRLPLALHLAVGHLRASHSVESFLALLKKKGLDLEPAYSNDPLLLEDRARAIIRQTFELSLELLRRQLGAGSEAERLLAGLAALGHASLSGFGPSLGAAIAELSQQDFRELAASASSLSLLTRVSNQERKDDAWRVHPLLAELLRGHDKAAIGLERMTNWFVERLPKLKPEKEQTQSILWKEIDREGSALADWLLRVPEQDHIRVVNAGSWFAAYQGPFPAWMDFCERALKSSLNPKERSKLLWTLANVSRMCGVLDRALSAAQEKRALDEGLQDPRGVALASAICANILADQGTPAEALHIFKREILPVFERLGDERERAVTLGRIADILEAQGELDEALRIRRDDVLPTFERLGEVREHAVTLVQVADILQSRGNSDEALRIIREEALPVFERLGAMFSRAVAMGKLADILHLRGDLDEALRIRREEQIPVYERLGIVRSRAVTLGKIADILQVRGELDEALRIRKEEQIPVFERIGDVRERALALSRVADILQAQGKLDEALRIRKEEELPVYEQLGDVHSRAVTLRNVADTFRARGELHEALRIHMEEELPVFKRLGDIRNCTLTLGRIADILQAQNRLDEALRIRREEELPVYERLGDTHSHAATLGKIANIYEAQGKHDDALHIMSKQVLPVFQRLGDIRACAATFGSIADILYAKGKLGEALRILRKQVLPSYERLNDMRSRAIMLTRVADILRDQGRLTNSLRILKSEVLPILQHFGDMHSQAGTLFKVASILRLQGRKEEALRILREEVLPVFERQGSKREHAVTLRLIAEITAGK